MRKDTARRWGIAAPFSLIGLLALAIGIAAPSPAGAQEEEKTPGSREALETGEAEADAAELERESSQKPIRGVDEIVVQGRRREELLMKTPISIRAFDAKELEERGITQVDQIGFSTANLKFDTTTGTNNNARVYIRGVGQDDARSLVDPGVGVYIDGIYMPRLTGGIFRLVDIEQIDVLRGPQGTLFGKNTVGGVISVRSRKPGREVGGNATFRAGNLGLFETNAALDLPIGGALSDKVFTRWSFASATDDGYVTNEAFTDGKTNRSGDNKYLGARVAIDILPSDSFSTYFTFDYSYEPELQRIGQCESTNPFNLGRLVGDNFTRFLSECDYTAEIGPDYRGYALGEDKINAQTFGYMLNPKWYINDSWSLQFLNSWRRRDVNARGGDIDQTPTKFIGGAGSTDIHDGVSAELLASGLLFDDKLTLDAGTYYFWEHGRGDNEGTVLRPFTPGIPAPCALPRTNIGEIDAQFTIQDPDCVLPSSGQTFSQFDSLTASLACILDIGDAKSDPTECAGAGNNVGVAPFPFQRGTASLNNVTAQDWSNWQIAVFTQGSYQVTDDVELTAGVRYTYEEKRRQGSLTPVFPCGWDTDLEPDGTCPVHPLTPANAFGAETFFRPFVPGLPQKKTADSWTPMALIGWQATDTIYTYARYARGFKSGGFNDTVLTQEEVETALALEGGEALLEFKDEKSDAFEIGVKSSWLDNRLSANITGFYTLYDDIQLTVIGVNANGILSAQILNAGEGRIGGFELEMNGIIAEDWVPGTNAGFLLSTGIGYTNANYSNFDTFQISPVSYNPDCNDPRNQGDPALCTPIPGGGFQAAEIEISDVCSTLRFEDCPVGGLAGDLPPNYVPVDPDREAGDPPTAPAPLAPGGSGSVLGAVGPITNPEVQPVNRSDLDFKNVPPWDVNASITYFTDISTLGDIAIRFDWAYQSAFFFNTDNTVGRDAINLVNFRFTYHTDRLKDLTLAFYMQNMLDERYLDGGVALGAGLGVDLRYWAGPRRLGFEATARF